MLNKAILMGRLTADPELKQTNNGLSVCSFTLAVDRDYKSENGERQADFINCVAWRERAEFLSKYFSKGSMVAVVGQIQTRSYEKDGQKRAATEVVCEQITFTGEKREKPAAPQAAEVEPDYGDNLPF